MNDIILLSMVCATVAFTITESKLFETFRNYMELIDDMVGKLFHCGYCLSHWISFLLVIIYKPLLFNSGYYLLDYFMTSLVITWLSAWQWLGFSYLISKSGK